MKPSEENTDLNYYFNPNINYEELSKNPRFLPELGSYEGWLTPLRYAWKSHRLKIEHPQLGTLYVEYEPEDELWLKDDKGITDKRLVESWEFYWLQMMLKKDEVEFVRKE